MNLLQYDSQCIVKTIKYVIMKPTASAIKAAIKFENLLEKDGTVSIQGKNLQTEMFKISKNFYVLSWVNYFITKLIMMICEIHMSFLFQM